MSGAELGLAVVGVVELCFRYGKELVATCHAFREADSRLSERVVRVEACWVRISTQLGLVEKLAHLMEARHRDVQCRALQVLLAKLQVAGSKLRGLTVVGGPVPCPAGMVGAVAATVRAVASANPTSGVAASLQLSLRPLAIQTRRLKYALTRGSLDEAVADLEAWQHVFDPTWFLMMKIASPEVDRLLSCAVPPPSSSSITAARHLRHAINVPPSDASPGLSPSPPLSRGTPSPVDPTARTSTPPVGASSRSPSNTYLPATGLQADSRLRVPFSPCSLAYRKQTSGGRLVLLDPVTYATERSRMASAVLRDLRDFTRRLAHADPALFGLLQCKGLLKDDEAKTCPLAFVFRVPEGYGPEAVQSLRGALVGGEELQSLSDRFELAAHVVRAVSYVHLYGYVHKNIRPETVLRLGPAGEDRGPLAVLVGFDILRNADGRTHRVSDDDWEKNLYRHPRRQGRRPLDEFEMRHDIYSVGVVLLELGLWESFVEYAADDGKDGRARPTEALTAGLCEDDAGISGWELMRDPGRVRTHLLALAQTRLPKRMGTRYSRVVETCLTCLDEDNEDFWGRARVPGRRRRGRGGPIYRKGSREARRDCSVRCE